MFGCALVGGVWKLREIKKIKAERDTSGQIMSRDKPQENRTYKNSRKEIIKRKWRDTECVQQTVKMCICGLKRQVYVITKRIKGSGKTKRFQKERGEKTNEQDEMKNRQRSRTVS